MGQRKSGRALNGWLILDKPAGPSSTAVLGRARRAFDARKAGHAGTLDPAATGVLAVAFGEATKTVPFVTEGAKVYRFMVRLGAATETDDAEGRVIAESAARPDEGAIRAALADLTGDIQQVPPQFSAVKVAGQRAYAIARGGGESLLAARPLHVARLDLVARHNADHLELEMECGKGGYVRSIARDLGAALGCHGHALWLRRLATGPFAIADAVTPDRVAAIADDPDLAAEARFARLDALLHPLEAALGGLAELPCAGEAATLLRRGNPGAILPRGAIPAPAEGAEAWASCDGQAVAIGTFRAGHLHPRRVILG